MFLCFMMLSFVIFSVTTSRSARQESFQHEVEVVLKLVQVYVTDAEGRPVKDLTISDFVLYDDDERQTITDFELHTLTLPQKQKISESPPSEEVPSKKLNRKFFIFIDTEGNGVRGLKKSKQAVLHFIDKHVRTDDEIGLLSYSHVTGLTIHALLDWDHEKIKNIIKNLKLVPGFVFGGGRRLRPSTDGLNTNMANMSQNNPNDNAGMFDYKGNISGGWKWIYFA